MAIDYNTDILPLFVTRVGTDEPYASVPAVLQDDEPERRILTTIEVIRAHMANLSDRTEANLLQLVLSALMEKVGSGGFVYTPEQLFNVGNICNPTFAAGASLDITIGGTTISPASASGGDIDTVIGELNTAIGAVTVAEVTDVTTIADTPAGKLSGRHFFLSDPTDDYYVWMSPNQAIAEIFDVTGIKTGPNLTGGNRFHLSSPTTDYYTWYDKRRAEVSVVTTVADVAGSLGGTSFLLNGIDTAPDGVPKAFYVWYDVPIKEVTEITVPADVAGSLGGTHWLINSAGDATAYYVWYDVTARAEVTDATAVADIAGSLGGTHWLINAALDATLYYVWYDVTPRAEVTDIDVTFDVNGSLSGTHWLLNSAGDATAYYVWYDFAAAAEVTEITVPADTEGSLGGTHWLINSAGDATAYYVWYDFAAVAEIYDVETVADVAGSLNSTFFRIDDPTTPYYVWYDVSSGGVDPSGANPGRTGISVAITTGDTADAVAVATRAAVGGVADFGTGGATNVVTITNANTGFVPDAVDGSAATGFTFPAVTTQGSATQVDPAPGGTGITVTIATNDTTTLVAEATFAAIDGVGDFGAVDAGAIVTVTNAATGFTTDASNVDAGVAVEVTTEGASTAVDPAPGGTGITVTILPDDGSTAVAEATGAAIDALGDFGTTDSEETVTVTNAAVGATTDASEVDAGVTVTVTTQGITASVDPAPGGRTAITVGIAGDAADTVVATATRVAVGANPDFIGGGAGATATITNAAVGDTTDATDVDTGFLGVTVTTQGITASVDPAPGGTGITVSIAGDLSAGSVAEATATAITAIGDFGATDAGSIVTVINAAGGATTDATDVDAGVFVEVTTQGTSGSVDPASAANSITVSLVVNDSSTIVAEKTATAVAAEPEFGAADVASTVTMTNAFGGTVTDVSDIDTGFSEIATTTQGLGANTDDPAPAGRTEIKVTIGSTDSSTAVAEKTGTAVGAVGDFSTTDFENNVTVTNTVSGVVLSPFDGNTSEFGSSITSVGVASGGTDPGPFAGRTTVTVSYSPGDSAAEVASDVSTAVGAIGDFSTEFSIATVEITNTETGVAPDGSAENSLFTVATPTQGAGIGSVEAFKTPLNKIGFRNVAGFGNISFTLADGSGGILGPAGVIAGGTFARPEVVSADAIGDAISAYVASPRDTTLI